MPETPDGLPRPAPKHLAYFIGGGLLDRQFLSVAEPLQLYRFPVPMDPFDLMVVRETGLSPGDLVRVKVDEYELLRQVELYQYRGRK